MVGEVGFEPTTTCFQGTYADLAALLPFNMVFPVSTTRVV